MKKFFAIYALPPSLVETPLFADQSEPARALENGHKIAVAQDGADVDLTVWAAKYAPRFQIVTALIKRAPEIFTSRVKGVKHHIICPNWGEHITGGVDSTGTFAVNASDLPQAGLPQITSGFVIKCMHNGCAGRDRLDHIAAMLADGTLAAEDLANEEFLLPEEPLIDISDLRTRAETEAEGASVSESDKSNDWPPLVRLDNPPCRACAAMCCLVGPVISRQRLPPPLKLRPNWPWGWCWPPARAPWRVGSGSW